MEIVHAFTVASPDATRDEIKHTMEGLVKAILLEQMFLSESEAKAAAIRDETIEPVNVAIYIDLPNEVWDSDRCKWILPDREGS